MNYWNPDHRQNREDWSNSGEAPYWRVGETADSPTNIELQKTYTQPPVNTTVDGKPDGGPAEYYDVPVGVITLNDVIEWKGETSWGGDAFHLGNLLKAAWRWGIKDGTTKEYDARKFMYSGARLLMKYAGVVSVRKTLQQMLDDPQFKDKS